MNNTTRRLPVYLVVDTSASMAGAPIEAVRQGIKAVVHELRDDPMAIEIAHLAVITFDDIATQASPLADLVAFHEPRLQASGSTALGAALDLLINRIQTDVRRSSPTEKGDYKPIIFILTDGQPTDAWQPAAQKLRDRKVTAVACAAGPYANAEVLRQITANVLELKTLEPGALRSFFTFVSASIRVVSQSVVKEPDGAPLPLPEPPPSHAA